jgi:hypothetical protein
MPVRPDLHRRPFKAHESPDQFIAYYRRMADAGVAPEILGATPEALVTPLHVRLEDWLLESPPRAAHQMAHRILAQLQTMHRIGICHRDIHIANIVVANETPLFVDPEFATDSDPGRPCYDLYGPGPSGIPVPPAHVAYPPNADGVWWDCAAEVPALHKTFGSLVSVEASRAH